MPARKQRSPQENQFNQQVGKLLEDARKRHGISVADLAAKLEISRIQLYRYESGARGMPVEKLVGAARHLGIPAAQLLPDVTKWKHS